MLPPHPGRDAQALTQAQSSSPQTSAEFAHLHMVAALHQLLDHNCKLDVVAPAQIGSPVSQPPLGQQHAAHCCPRRDTPQGQSVSLTLARARMISEHCNTSRAAQTYLEPGRGTARNLWGPLPALLRRAAAELKLALEPAGWGRGLAPLYRGRPLLQLRSRDARQSRVPTGQRMRLAMVRRGVLVAEGRTSLCSGMDVT